MITLERRGKVYYAVGQLNGRRIHQSLRTRDRDVADALRRNLELHLLSGGRLSHIFWKDFQEEFLRWAASQVKSKPRSTLSKYRFVVERFARFLETQHISELHQIQSRTIVDYTEERRRDVHPTRGNTVGTEGIKSDLRILHRVFSYAEQEAGYIGDNPVRIKRLASKTGETMPFRDTEVALMLEEDQTARSPKLRAIVLTFLFTGFRISDVKCFPMSTVDLKNDRIIRSTQKRGKIVSLAIHPELRKALEVHLAYRNEAQKQSPYVFSTDTGNPMENLDAIVRGICNRAGIKGGRSHRFRDTFAVRLLATGASLYDVAKMLGISMRVAEESYAPYVKELQERGANLISGLSVPIGDSAKSSHSGTAGNLVQFCSAPPAPALPHSSPPVKSTPKRHTKV